MWNKFISKLKNILGFLTNSLGIVSIIFLIVIYFVFISIGYVAIKSYADFQIFLLIFTLLFCLLSCFTFIIFIICRAISLQNIEIIKRNAMHFSDEISELKNIRSENKYVKDLLVKINSDVVTKTNLEDSVKFISTTLLNRMKEWKNQ